MEYLGNRHYQTIKCLFCYGGGSLFFKFILLEKALSHIDACMVINCVPHTNPESCFREESCSLKI